MVQAFGAAATPLSFGEVYTAIQQHVIDGAENNELALTNNKHGEVAKYFSYTCLLYTSLSRGPACPARKTAP